LNVRKRSAPGIHFEEICRSTSALDDEVQTEEPGELELSEIRSAALVISDY